MTVDSFWEKVDRGQAGECWPWRGKINRGGYGRFYADGREQQAHRLAYELLVGPIPDGLQLDHLCRNRACVNPAHLEPVTSRENTLRGDGISAQRARQTACLRGHPLDDSNTYVHNGKRWCRECRRRHRRAHEAKARLAARST